MSVERRNHCLSNLKQIEAAKQAFAAKSQKTNSYTVLCTDIYGPGKGKIDPERTCPSGGYYIIGTIRGSQYKAGTIDVETTCSIHGSLGPK